MPRLRPRVRLPRPRADQALEGHGPGDLTAKEIRDAYGMSLTELAYFIASETPRTAREMRERRRRSAASGSAAPAWVPRDMPKDKARKMAGILNEITSSAKRKLKAQAARNRRQSAAGQAAASRTGAVRSTGPGDGTSPLAGIRAKESCSPTPLGRDLTSEERRAKWQPPDRDTSRFSGTSISRHGASSSYKGSGGYGGYQPHGDGAGVYDLLADSRKMGHRKAKIKALPSEPKQGTAFALEVIDGNGRRVYQCGEAKRDAVLKRLTGRLPKGSYSPNGNTVRLHLSLEALGFGSKEEFAKWCAGPKSGNRKPRRKRKPEQES